MKIYIAAPFELRDEAIAAGQVLKARGHEITSTWLRDPGVNDDIWARIDLGDVKRADALVLLNPEDYRNSGTGGRHAEFGYAIALGKRLVVVGVRSNIFHQLSYVRVIEKIEDI